MDEVGGPRARLAVGFGVGLLAAGVGSAAILIVTATGIPEETGTQAAWLLISPAIAGAAIALILSVAGVVNRVRGPRLVGLAAIALVATIAWLVIIMTALGLLALLLFSSNDH